MVIRSPIAAWPLVDHELCLHCLPHGIMRVEVDRLAARGVGTIDKERLPRATDVKRPVTTATVIALIGQVLPATVEVDTPGDLSAPLSRPLVLTVATGCILAFLVLGAVSLGRTLGG